jgi:hypothetical protein
MIDGLEVIAAVQKQINPCKDQVESCLPRGPVACFGNRGIKIFLDFEQITMINQLAIGGMYYLGLTPPMLLAASCNLKSISTQSQLSESSERGLCRRLDRCMYDSRYIHTHTHVSHRIPAGGDIPRARTR